VRIGLHAPQLGRAVNPALMIDIARRAEDAGFSDLWFSDHIAVPADSGMPSFFPEPIVLMAAVAAHTERIGLGTSVLIPAYRNPMHLAKQWATLDWLAPGRTILGVGAGWLASEFEACQVSYERRGDRLDDYIDGWRAVWSGQTEHESDHFSFSGVRSKPQPRIPIPIWIGGSSKGAISRAARCDGWHPTWMPVEVFARTLARLRDELAARSRAPEEVTVSMHMEVRIGDEVPSAGYWSEVGDHHGEGDVQVGSVDDLDATLHRYARAGLEHVVLTPQCHSREDWHEQASALAELVARRR